MSNPSLAEMKAHFERAAAELEVAARHCRIAAEHFAAQEVPRGCAHGFAALGNMAEAQEALTAATRLHATKART
jgi:hypothetical protein